MFDANAKHSLLPSYLHVFRTSAKESNGFVLEYSNGSTTDTCPKGLVSTLSFVCNKSAIWPDLIDYNVTEYMTAADDEDFCQACTACSSLLGNYLLQ